MKKTLKSILLLTTTIVGMSCSSDKTIPDSINKTFSISDSKKSGSDSTNSNKLKLQLKADGSAFGFDKTITGGCAMVSDKDCQFKCLICATRYTADSHGHAVLSTIRGICEQCGADFPENATSYWN